MSKPFKTWHVDQMMLLPPSVQELVPEGHLAHFVRDTARDSLDLSAIVDTYTEDRHKKRGRECFCDPIDHQRGIQRGCYPEPFHGPSYSA